MPYVPYTWVDEVLGATPAKYQIVDDVNGVIGASATIAIVTAVTTPGTPVNATRMNQIEGGIQTAQAAAEAAQAAANAAQATANVKITQPANPSTTSLVKLSPAGSPSTQAIKLTVQIQVTYDDTDVDTTAVAYFFIPSTMDGMNLIRAQGFVLTAGTTNPTTIQVRNLTKYPSNDSLSTPISIASGATVGTVGVVDLARDDLSTNDKIRILVTGNSTVKAKGLFVVLEYILP